MIVASIIYRVQQTEPCSAHKVELSLLVAQLLLYEEIDGVEYYNTRFTQPSETEMAIIKRAPAVDVLAALGFSLQDSIRWSQFIGQSVWPLDTKVHMN